MLAELPTDGPTAPTYTAFGQVAVDVLSNVDGGIQQGTRTIHFVLAGVEFDLSPNLRGLISLIHNDDTLFTAPVGDDQIVSNIEAGFQGLRLNEAWLEYYTGHFSLLGGVYDFNSEFDVLESANLFINSAYGIGNDIGLSGANGPGIFPNTGLALRFKWEMEQHSVKFAALDGQPGDLADLSSFDLSLSSEQGAMLAGEYRYGDDMQTWLVGVWRYTQSTPVYGVSQQDVSGNTGYYLRGEFDVSSLTSNKDTQAFFRIGRADPEFNKYEWFYSAGFNTRSWIRGRENDRIGLAFSLLEMGDQSKDQSLNSTEWNIELSYQASVNHWLSLQPHVQWVGNPGAQRDIDDSLVIGFRCVTDF